MGWVSVPQKPGCQCSMMNILLAGIKFIVLTDPKLGYVDGLLKRLYELYSDYALKNPYYSIDMPIRWLFRYFFRLTLEIAHQHSRCDNCTYPLVIWLWYDIYMICRRYLLVTCIFCRTYFSCNSFTLVIEVVIFIIQTHCRCDSFMRCTYCL